MYSPASSVGFFRAAAMVEDTVTQMTSLRFGLHTQLALKCGRTTLVLAYCEPPLAAFGIVAHQRSMSSLAERVETEKAMGHIGGWWSIEPAAQRLDCEAAKSPSLDREPLLESWGADRHPGKKIALVERNRLFEGSRFVGAGEAFKLCGVHYHRIRLQVDDIAFRPEDGMMLT
jgi:hypothetical protein